MPAISTALAVGLGVAAAGSIGSAAIGAHAAGEAAKTQSQAAMSAAELQKQEADNALAFQKQQWETQQQNLAPWLKAGTGAIGELSSLTSTPGQGLLTPWTEQFTAPTGVTEANDPGYQFRLQQGLEVLQNSAAAKGNLLSGNTSTALLRYGQDYASNEYSNVYDRALKEYQQRYNIFNQNQTNEFNRLAALSGTGQTAANTLGTLGTDASRNVGNILLTSGAQQAQDIQNAAAARASGYIGGANAWGGALGGTSNNIMNLLLLSQMQGGGGLGNNPNAWDEQAQW